MVELYFKLPVTCVADIATTRGFHRTKVAFRCQKLLLSRAPQTPCDACDMMPRGRQGWEVRVEQRMSGGEGRERVREGRRMLMGRDMDEGQLQAAVGGWVAAVHEWVGRFSMLFSCGAMETRRKRAGNGLECNSSDTGGRGGGCQLRGKGRKTVGRAGEKKNDGIE